MVSTGAIAGLIFSSIHFRRKPTFGCKGVQGSLSCQKTERRSRRRSSKHFILDSPTYKYCTSNAACARRLPPPPPPPQHGLEHCNTCRFSITHNAAPSPSPPSANCQWTERNSEAYLYETHHGVRHLAYCNMTTLFALTLRATKICQ
jgi:hypothetical protein